MIKLSWKEFNVNVGKVGSDFRAILSANYDGLVCDELAMTVMFLSEPSPEDVAMATNYWDALTPESFEQPVDPQDIVRASMYFGQNLIAEFGAEPEMNALSTQQTIAAIQLLAPVQMMLLTGAVATALAYVDSMDTQGLISAELVAKYRGKLATYLGV